MDVTPQLLTEVKFREEWRGYNRDEVDNFLERLAVALKDLQSRFDQMSERAARAEQQLLESTSEDQVRRTLVLAQRTADAALDEAREESERMMSEAEEHARATIAEAEERAALLEADAQSRTQAELGSLAARRAELSAEAEALADFVAEHRGRLQAELREQLSWLGKPGRLELPPPPPLSPLPFPVEAEHEPQPTEAFQVQEAWADDYGDEWDAGVPAPWEDEQADESHQPVFLDDAQPDVVGDATGEVLPVGLGGYDDGGYSYGNGNGHYGNGNGHALQSATPERRAEGHLLSEEAPSQPDIDLAMDDDPFLAELRRAVTDTEPLGPRDHEPQWNPMPDDELSTSELFGRKRRR